MTVAGVGGSPGDGVVRRGSRGTDARIFFHSYFCSSSYARRLPGRPRASEGVALFFPPTGLCRDSVTALDRPGGRRTGHGSARARFGGSRRRGRGVTTRFARRSRASWSSRAPLFRSCTLNAGSYRRVVKIAARWKTVDTCFDRAPRAVQVRGVSSLTACVCWESYFRPQANYSVALHAYSGMSRHLAK